MEVVPTNDGDDDDGVVWYRCPLCQGFLPKLKEALDDSATEDTPTTSTATTSNNLDTTASGPGQNDNLPWDSPAAMMKELKDVAKGSSPKQDVDPADPPEFDDDVLVGVAFDPVVEPGAAEVVEGASEPKPFGSETDSHTKPKEDIEPILEYAAMLAETDVAEAAPYRPWETYEVGQCINHLAWNDCGVVVSKEVIPGGRYIIKCYFEEAGVVRLIEQDHR